LPSSDPVQRFQEILDNIARIQRFTAGLSLDSFGDNEQTIFAVKHALLIISEAAAKLGDLAPELCPVVPWPDIRGLGNRLRHEYHAIDIIRLWRLVTHDLTPLQSAVEEALARLRGSDATGWPK
jgi:uncharacterized protein with HEPN domain